MSGRLDQSLDSIIDSQKKAKRDSRHRKVPNKTRSVAPVGGVKKATKPNKPALKSGAIATSQGRPSTKVIVSNLPTDVTEQQIKDYFGKTCDAGQIKKVALHYNQNGQSRGVAEIIFSKPHAAEQAVAQSGIVVDTRKIRIELVVTADALPKAQPPKSLADRVTANPKVQPKSAVATKKGVGKDGAKGQPAGKAGKPKRTRASRPKAKTAEELDAEMTDYWGGNNTAAAGTATNAAATNGAAPAATSGEDMGMEEIS